MDVEQWKQLRTQHEREEEANASRPTPKKVPLLRRYEKQSLQAEGRRDEWLGRTLMVIFGLPFLILTLLLIPFELIFLFCLPYSRGEKLL